MFFQKKLVVFMTDTAANDSPLRHQERRQIADVLDEVDVDRIEHHTLVSRIPGKDQGNKSLQPSLV